MKMHKYVSWLAAATLLAACNSPLDVDPTASIDAGTALSTPRGIELALNGAYNSLQSGNLYGQEEMVFPDLYADNLDFTGTFQTHREFGLRNVTSTNGAILGHWAQLYDGINTSNNLLEAIEAVTALTSEQHDQFRGEALFIRALNYSILAKYFGDVPLVLAPARGVGEEALVSRDPAASVYAQIVTDLTESISLLGPDRNNGRATQGAAQALLARVHLETGDNAGARDMATAVITNAEYDLNANFVTNWSTKNSEESIFELQYGINDGNNQAFWFYPQSLGGRWGYAPSLSLFNAFEAGDARRDVTIQVLPSGCANPPCRYGDKYFRIATSDDNVVVLRLAEMYLIRAEANARLGAADQTVRDDLDILRNRAGLADLPVTVAGQAALLAAVLQERRVELAFEGHRFFDLRRHGVAATVLSLAPDRLVFPIPQAELDVNENLTQNPGY